MRFSRDSKKISWMVLEVIHRIILVLASWTFIWSIFISSYSLSLQPWSERLYFLRSFVRNLYLGWFSSFTVTDLNQLVDFSFEPASLSPLRTITLSPNSNLFSNLSKSDFKILDSNFTLTCKVCIKRNKIELRWFHYESGHDTKVYVEQRFLISSKSCSVSSEYLPMTLIPIAVLAVDFHFIHRALQRSNYSLYFWIVSLIEFEIIFPSINAQAA